MSCYATINHLMSDAFPARSKGDQQLAKICNLYEEVSCDN